MKKEISSQAIMDAAQQQAPDRRRLLELGRLHIIVPTKKKSDAGGSQEQQLRGGSRVPAKQHDEE